MYGFLLYNISLGSGIDSFKFIFSEEDFLDFYIERGEEVVEYCEDFDLYRFGFFWVGVRYIIK